MEKLIDMIAADIASQYVTAQSAENLSELIARAAEEYALPDEAIKRLVERTNRAVFLMLFKTGQEDTFEFPIATYEDVKKHLLPSSKEEELDQFEDVTVPIEDYILTEADMKDLDIKDIISMDLTPREIVEYVKDIKRQLDEKLRRHGARVARMMIAIVKTAAAKAGDTASKLRQNEAKIIKVLEKFKKLGFDTKTFGMLLDQMKVDADTKTYLLSLFKNLPAVVKTAELDQNKLALEFVSSMLQPNEFTPLKLEKLARMIDPDILLKYVQPFGEKFVKEAQYYIYKALSNVDERWSPKTAEAFKELGEHLQERATLLKQAAQILNSLEEVAAYRKFISADEWAAVRSAAKAGEFVALERAIKGGVA